jgi:pimeloyl-ACP methyl ester carboxylesterase
MTQQAQPAGKNRRWPIRTLIGVALFLAVFYLGGGWYFSGKIHAGGLLPEAPNRNFDVTIEKVEDGTVVLAGVDESISDPGDYALVWDGGYGWIGGIDEVDASGVSRPFTLVEGTPPMSPDEVDLDAWYFPSDPSDAGLGFSDVTFSSSVGDLDAWYVPASSTPTETWAIHVHGWRVDERETIRALGTFKEAGIDSLVIEYRNDADAPSDPTGLYRFGRTEWQDVEGAVLYALDHGASRIVLVGYSTGAAADMAFLERSDNSGSVVGVVFDSPNIDFGRVVKHEAQETSLIPGLPLKVPNSLTTVAMFMADVRYDVGWDEINYVSRPDVLAVPALVFHGDADGTVPLSVSKDFALNNPDLVTLVVTPGADHVRSWNVDIDGYESTLEAFLGSL